MSSMRRTCFLRQCIFRDRKHCNSCAKHLEKIPAVQFEVMHRAGVEFITLRLDGQFLRDPFFPKLAHRPASCMALAARCTASTMRDRKSTRLNSSHSQISYAVFCLKKKNKIVVRDIQITLKPMLRYFIDISVNRAEPSGMFNIPILVNLRTSSGCCSVVHAVPPLLA